MKHKYFTIDPSFCREAVLAGRTLYAKVWEDDRSGLHLKVEVGEPSKHVKKS